MAKGMRGRVAPKETVRVLVVDLESHDPTPESQPTGAVQPVLQALAASGFAVVGVAPGFSRPAAVRRWVRDVATVASAGPQPPVTAVGWAAEGDVPRADVTVLCGPLRAARRWLERNRQSRGWQPVLVVASAHDPAAVRDLLRMGASGWLGSQVSAPRLQSAVMAVAAGSVVLPGESVWQVLGSRL